MKTSNTIPKYFFREVVLVCPAYTFFYKNDNEYEYDYEMDSFSYSYSLSMLTLSVVAWNAAANVLSDIVKSGK